MGVACQYESLHSISLDANLSINVVINGFRSRNDQSAESAST